MADINRLIGFMSIMQVPFMNDPDALMYIEEVKNVLKEQEPRVMELEDIDGVPDHHMEYFTESVYEPNMGYARIHYDGKWDMVMIDGTRYHIHEDMKDYGRTWRCWTAKPTDEQREAVKWDG